MDPDSSLGTPAKAPESATVVKLHSGSHDFKIIGYSSFRNVVGRKWIKSQTFTVGGHQWCLRFFPNNIIDTDDSVEHVAIFLELVNATSDVDALFDIRILDSMSGAPCVDTPEVAGPNHFDAPNDVEGFIKFMPKKDLETSNYLRDDCLTFRCNIVVINEIADTAENLANATVDELND